jgi:hypothetical protein
VINSLIEYKIEIVEKTTYYVQRLAVREFHVQMLFATTKENLVKFDKFKKKLQQLQDF